MSNIDDDNVPQWKKDLIARLRSQNRKNNENTMPSAAIAGHQPIPVVTHPLSNQHDASCNNEPPSLKSPTSRSASSPVSPKMVQERLWFDNKQELLKMVEETDTKNDSDSSEDLHYGPGIVNKLKKKYQSLAHRQNNARPSILRLRKATSLENLLDEDDGSESERANRLFQPRINGNDTGRTAQNRYRPAGRRVEMKRARSVETISRSDRLAEDDLIPVTLTHSVHEEALIKEEIPAPHRNSLQNEHDNDTTNENNRSSRLNRPRRLQPIVSEKERPPADFVKHAKMFFEKSPERRTKKPPHTGDVAAKVDTFNSIIVKTKAATKKPPIKHVKPVRSDAKSNTHTAVRPVAKPVLISPTSPTKHGGFKNDYRNERNRNSTKTDHHRNGNDRCDSPTTRPGGLLITKKQKEMVRDASTPSSPIPDVSRVENESGNENTPLSETPDIILVSSPSNLISPTYQKTITEKFVKEEIYNSSTTNGDNRHTNPFWAQAKQKPSPPPRRECKEYSTPSPVTVENNIMNGSERFDVTKPEVNQEHLPACNVSEEKIPPSEPLKIEVNGFHIPNEEKPKILSPPSTKIASPPIRKIASPPLPKVVSPALPKTVSPPLIRNGSPPVNVTKIEEVHKYSVNSASERYSVEVVNKIVLPKKTRQKQQEETTAVFNFTNRKDVPDYISNDKSRTPLPPQMPKPGEGGIIIIPGATTSDSFLDEEEEILRSLERPPSPCDVDFVNDNIIIDGKSSIRQRNTNRVKLKIVFVEDDPDIYEYPSEDSILLDFETPLSPVSNCAHVGRTVPTLAGSTLANYTPKTTGEFQPGVTKSIQPTKLDITDVQMTSEVVLEEVEMPVVFSAGHNTDILF